MNRKQAKEFFEKLNKLCSEYKIEIRDGGLIKADKQLIHTCVLTYEDYTQK